MAHGLEGGVERERLRTMVAMASIFLDRDTKACQFCNGVRKGPLVVLCQQFLYWRFFFLQTPPPSIVAEWAILRKEATAAVGTGRTWAFRIKKLRINLNV